MLRRTALGLLALLVTAAAGLFAADRMGVNLPWNIASLSELGSGEDGGSASSADAEKAEQIPSKAAENAESAIEDTVAALTGEPPGVSEPAPGSVALDISRISPDGPSVFAGRAEPGAYVTVFENGKPAGTVQADQGGSWSLSTEHKFASADPNITFEAAPTPPPKPEPEQPPARTAAADTDDAPPAGQQQTETAAPQQPAEDTSAPAVAGDVMRKFEELVSEAREDAAREKAASDDAEPDDAEQRKAEREDGDAAKDETTVAAASPPAPAHPEAAASADEPAQETAEDAKEKEEAAKDEQQAPSSDARASASADAAPGATSTLENETAEKTTETETAMMAGPAKSAKPETQAPIPVPIMFVYNQPTLTPEGERAAELLLEYLLLKRLDAIELTGHADERGTHAYNFDLSRERLEAVARILKEGGYQGELKLTPKGKTEPFTGIDRKKYRGEALYQFDRRVELRVTR